MIGLIKWEFEYTLFAFQDELVPNPKSSTPRIYEENIIFVYDLISYPLCITTPVLDKCVKSITKGMFTNKNYRKKEKNVFKIFANTNIINLNHTCKIKHVWKSVALGLHNIEITLI